MLINMDVELRKRRDDGIRSLCARRRAISATEMRDLTHGDFRARYASSNGKVALERVDSLSKSTISINQVTNRHEIVMKVSSRCFC